MAVRVVSRGKESEDKLKKKGVTPGKISSGVTKSNNQGDIKVTVKRSGGGSSSNKPVVKQTKETSTVVNEPTKKPVPQTVGVAVSKSDIRAAEASLARQGIKDARSFIKAARSGKTPVQQRSEELQRQGYYYDFGTGKKVPKPGVVYNDAERFSVVTSGNAQRNNLSSGVVETNRTPKKVLQTYEEPKDKTVSGRLRRFEKEQEFKSLTTERSGSIDPAGRRAAAFGAGFIATLIEPVEKPIQTVKGTVTSILYPKKTFNAIKERATIEPYGFGGEITAIIATPKIYGGTFKIAKNTYIKTGSTYVPTTKTFDTAVISGESKFPTSTGTDNALSEFGKSNIVQTSAPKKIKGVVGEGGRAAAGLEDPGIYVTPEGRGSPYFLRINKGASTYSFNPFKDLRNRIGIPTVTRFEVKGVATYPKSVVETPGFSSVKAYQEATSGQGLAYITKRSMIGQGEIKPQAFTNAKGFKVMESGTIELEAVIPKGSTYTYNPRTVAGRIKGFDYYTTYKGRNVAIRNAVLNSDDLSIYRSDNARIFKANKLGRESNSLSSAYSNYEVPNYNVIRAVNYNPDGSSFNTGSLTTSTPRSASGSDTSFSPRSSISSAPGPLSFSPVSSGVVASAASLTPASGASSYKGISTSISGGFSGGPSRGGSRGGSSSYSSGFSGGSGSSSPTTPNNYYPPTIYNGRSYGRRTNNYYRPLLRTPPTTKTPSLRLRKSKKDDELFDVYARRKGQDIKIGRSLTATKAKKALKNFLETTPAASGFATTTSGRVINPSKLGLGNRYTTSKRDPFRIVERNRYRISTGGEVRGISLKGVASQRKTGGLFAF